MVGFTQRQGLCNMASISMEAILEDLSTAPKDDTVFKESPEEFEKGLILFSSTFSFIVSQIKATIE